MRPLKLISIFVLTIISLGTSGLATYKIIAHGAKGLVLSPLTSSAEEKEIAGVDVISASSFKGQIPTLTPKIKKYDHEEERSYEDRENENHYYRGGNND